MIQSQLIQPPLCNGQTNSQEPLQTAWQSSSLSSVLWSKLSAQVTAIVNATLYPISLKSDKLAANELGSRNMNWYLVGKSRPIGCREADDGLAGKQGRHHDMSGILYSKSNRPACEGPRVGHLKLSSTGASTTDSPATQVPLATFSAPAQGRVLVYDSVPYYARPPRS